MIKIHPKSAVLGLSISQAWWEASLLQASCLYTSVCRAFGALWFNATAQSCKLAAGSIEANSTLGTSFGEKLQRGVASALVDLKTLAKHPVYVLNVAATAVYTGTACSPWQYSFTYSLKHCSLLSNVLQQRQALPQLNLQGSLAEAPFCFFQL